MNKALLMSDNPLSSQFPHSGHSPLVEQLPVGFSGAVASTERLELGEHNGQPLVPHVLQTTENTSSEEHLRAKVWGGGRLHHNQRSAMLLLIGYLGAAGYP